jgi:hypothetical protein
LKGKIPEYDEIDYEKEEDEEEPDTSLTQYDDGEDIDVPDIAQSVIYKYQVEADIPKTQKPTLDPYRPFYGRHVSLGNTKRKDNPRFLDAYDLATILDECPTLRHRGTALKGRVTSELQMCRSNPPVGGFERRMEATIIKQQDIDVKDTRFQNDPIDIKKKRFSLFRRNR